MIVVVDFGSQTAHLIARRVKELGAEAEIVTPKTALKKIIQKKPKGIIFSGGPSSVYVKNAPTMEKEVFNLGIPVLGICYGLQLTAHLLGGKVVHGKKEYGPSKFFIKDKRDEMVKGLPESFDVWMSHGDEVISLPKGFEVLGSTSNVCHSFVGNKEKKIYGLQYHPEVEHTQNGETIFKNFLSACKEKSLKKLINVKEMEEKIRKEVGDSYVIGAVSGGVDSTVAAFLVAKAIGDHFIPVYVENGLMRQGTREHVEKIFKKIGIRPIVIETVGETLKKLRGINDPEQKRKIIGKHYIDIFEQKMQNLVKSLDAGYVEVGEGQVIIKPKEIVFKSSSLNLR